MKRAIGITLLVWSIAAQIASGQGARGGGIDAIPGLTAVQRAEVVRGNEALAQQAAAVGVARNGLSTAVFAEVRNPAAIAIMASAVREAELAFVMARANELARIQASGGRLSVEQVAAWKTAVAGGGGRGGRGAASYPTQRQAAALAEMNAAVAPLVDAASAARNALQAASAAEMTAKADDLKAAELALANARAEAFAKLQSSTARLAPDYVASLVASGGGGRGGGGLGFTLPEPIDFGDHAGYRAIFDGKTLKGWDGNPKFWRVEDGAIVGESTPQNPSGNSYIAYRDVEAKDFTLKFEIKVEGAGGSGLQYRSKTGIPWLAGIAPNVTANVGPVNLAWMMSGPQADFWPNSPYWTGQFYSENTPMRIMAWRGQVVEGAGMGPKRLMGNIGDRDALGKLVKMNDWNQYTVIARGGVLIHILNGQLMAVMVDDDPQSSNNWSGLFGIEIEATTKVSVREIWLKKLN